MGTKLERFSGICRDHGVGLAYAFGSAAADLCRLLDGAPAGALCPMADLDLGVVFVPPLAALSVPAHVLYARLHSELSDLIGAALDLVFLEETHSLFQVQAIAGICLYSSSPELRMEFELAALRRAADFRYHFEQYHLERREALG